LSYVFEHIQGFSDGDDHDAFNLLWSNCTCNRKSSYFEL